METENEITTREFSKKVLAVQDVAKRRAYKLHLAKGGVDCYEGYNPKWDNFGIRILLNEVTQNPYPMTYERHVYYDYLDMPEEEWQKLLDNIKKEYVKLLDENNPILKRKKELREEITQAVSQHDTGKSVVIPIIVRSCNWEWSILEKVKDFCIDTHPINTYSDKDTAWTNIIQGITKHIPN